jgi:serine/threonine protein kinase
MREPSQRHKRSKRLGRYELLEELSRHGDGVTYKARDPLLGRFVAIKTVARSAAAPPGSGNDEFERMVKLAGGLNHPNIVIVYDTGTNRDVAYIATELVDGRTLRAMLDSGSALPPVAIERIVAQVADGLEFTHQHAIVHGDVSPSTLVVLDIGFVKISCLGNALFPMGSRVPQHSTSEASPYVSPEQAMGGVIDARSDVFSLGAVLYEMLTGIAPFSGSTPDELVDAIKSRNPQKPSSVNRNIPSGFDYIVARALSKEPDHRYQRARDMASDLRKWALEEPTFFATPRCLANTAQTTHPEPSGIAKPPEPRAEGPGKLRTRRQWLLYGVPGALLTFSAGWAVMSRRAPTRQPGTEARASTTPATPQSAAVEVVQVRNEAPSTAQIEMEPLGSSAADSARTRVETQPKARVNFAVSPWGEIYVDGKRKGVTPPLRQVELAPGKYWIEIKNTIFPPRRQFVEVKANARLRIKHRFK